MNRFIITGPITEPCGTPLLRGTSVPSALTKGALNHRSIYSTAHRSLTCLRTALINSDQSSSSNAFCMSNSMTQSYFQHLSRVTPTACKADLLGRYHKSPDEITAPEPVRYRLSPPYERSG